MKKILLSGVALLALAIGPALGADMRMPVKAPPPAPPPPPPVQDWSGIYVGVEGGYGWGRQDGGNVPFLFLPRRDQLTCVQGGLSCDPTISDSHFQDFVGDFAEIQNLAGANIGHVNNSGWLFGAFWGAQKQWGSWVLGLEGDIEGANIKGTSTAFASAVNPATATTDIGEDDITVLRHTASLEAKIDMLGRVAGKVGYAFSPNWMIYADGGMAFAHVKDTLTDTQNVLFGTLCDPGSDPFADCDHVRAATNSIFASANQSMFGWTVGAGVDYKVQIDPGSAWVFGVDYRYYQFPSQTFTFSDPNTGLSTAFNSKQTINVVQGRISYLFSIH